MMRIKFLDGFRGLAIIMVVLYHVFNRWTDFLPFGDKYAHFPLFQKGWLGVQLFFLISGFVILMSLEKSKNFKEFISKRWLRLFPAMLVATVLLYATAGLLPERPMGAPVLRDMIPGLLFVQPSWIELLFRSPQGVLEGAFWSLFVEVKFYIVFGLIYFYAGRMRAIQGISALFGVALAANVASRLTDNGIVKIADMALRQLSFDHFGWFAAGALTYLYFVGKDKKLLTYAFAVGVFSSIFTALSHWTSWYVFFVAVGILALFIATICYDRLKTVFEYPFFMYFGFVSYPLYLIHENALVALTVKMHAFFPQIPDLLLPVIPIAILTLVAHLIAKFIELPLGRLLKRLFDIKKNTGRPVEP